jgi:hypothetical protein
MKLVTFEQSELVPFCIQHNNNTETQTCVMHSACFIASLTYSFVLKMEEVGPTLHRNFGTLIWKSTRLRNPECCSSNEFHFS